jgi:methylase of polypeptide subunit release factors
MNKSSDLLKGGNLMAQKTLGLYIHIPFCRSKCDYCDFYSLAGREDIMDRYQSALTAQIRETAPGAKDYLVDNGVLFMECGIGQAQNISEMFSSIGSVEIIKDYENIERIVKVVF